MFGHDRIDEMSRLQRDPIDPEIEHIEAVAIADHVMKLLRLDSLPVSMSA